MILNNIGAFAERLRKELDDNKITMYKLAKDLNLSKQTVCNWCSGANEPKATQIAEVCKYLNVSADYLLGLTNAY